MADPSRRQDERFPCDIPAVLYTPSSGSRIGKAKLVDLALGGGMIETAVSVLRRVPYELRWDWNGESLRVPARVAWEKPKDPATKLRRYGLSFTTTSEQEQILRRLVDALRQGLWSHRGPRP